VNYKRPDSSRFYVGQRFAWDGAYFRVRQGNRCTGDMVLDMSLDRGKTWVSPPIAWNLIFTAFKFGVEENNYGPHGKVKRGNGGKYLMDALAGATDDWLKQANEVEKQAERAKSNRPVAA
jgi:hypothetical protein